MVHEVFVGSEAVKGVFTSIVFKNESIANEVFRAALKFGRVSFVLSYPQK